jgi:hypothetical protein
MPGYWFMHNMYALARNSWKYVDRDKRTEKTQLIEYDYLAPDSVEEMLASLPIMEAAVGKAWQQQQQQANGQPNDKTLCEKGRALLLQHPAEVARLTVLAEGMENSQRCVQLLKVEKVYPLFKELIVLYGIRNILSQIDAGNITSFADLQTAAKTARLSPWVNVGGQLMKAETVEDIKSKIKKGKINSWPQLHETYVQLGQTYAYDKLQHAIASMLFVQDKAAKDLTPELFSQNLQQSVSTMEKLTEGIYRSREKDYQNPFRKMSYESEAEMETVIGKLDDNGFIQQTIADLAAYKKQVKDLLKKWETIINNE